MIKDKLNHRFDTLLEAIKAVEVEGYVTAFFMKMHGLEDPNTKKIYAAQDIVNVEYIRIEAPFSDPDEEIILYLIIAKDKVKGWISDSYGIYSDSKLTNLFSKIEKLNA